MVEFMVGAEAVKRISEKSLSHIFRRVLFKLLRVLLLFQKGNKVNHPTNVASKDLKDCRS